MEKGAIDELVFAFRGFLAWWNRTRFMKIPWNRPWIRGLQEQ